MFLKNIESSISLIISVKNKVSLSNHISDIIMVRKNAVVKAAIKNI